MTDDRVHKREGTSGDTSLGLLDKARAQDQAAWERLVRLYEPLVARWCARANLADADALDVTQEVLAAVNRNLADFERRKSGSFRSWLRTITRTKIADHRRRLLNDPAAAGGSDAKRRLESIPHPESAGILDVDDPEEPGIIHRRALELIASEFEQNTWRAFLRTVIDGATALEVAGELGMSRSAVYTAKSRVLKRLRDEFKGLLEDD